MSPRQIMVTSAPASHSSAADSQALWPRPTTATCWPRNSAKSAWSAAWLTTSMGRPSNAAGRNSWLGRPIRGGGAPRDGTAPRAGRRAVGKREREAAAAGVDPLDLAGVEVGQRGLLEPVAVADEILERQRIGT